MTASSATSKRTCKSEFAPSPPTTSQFQVPRRKSSIIIGCGEATQPESMPIATTPVRTEKCPPQCTTSSNEALRANPASSWPEDTASLQQVEPRSPAGVDRRDGHVRYTDHRAPITSGTVRPLGGSSGCCCRCASSARTQFPAGPGRSRRRRLLPHQPVRTHEHQIAGDHLSPEQLGSISRLAYSHNVVAHRRWPKRLAADCLTDTDHFQPHSATRDERRLTASPRRSETGSLTGLPRVRRPEAVVLDLFAGGGSLAIAAARAEAVRGRPGYRAGAGTRVLRLDTATFCAGRVAPCGITVRRRVCAGDEP